MAPGRIMWISPVMPEYLARPEGMAKPPLRTASQMHRPASQMHRPASQMHRPASQMHRRHGQGQSPAPSSRRDEMMGERRGCRMTYETLLVERDERGVARLTLNRPDVHNALSTRMLEELPDAAATLDGDKAVRVVVLTGAGVSFCAGGDLRWMQEARALDRAGRLRESGKIAAVLQALDNLSKPLVGRINGQAYAGGLGLIAACDIVVAARSARFAVTEVRLGLIPANIGPYLFRRMGEAKAREVFFNAKAFDAEAALRLGLVSQIVDDGGLDSA